MGAMHQRMEKVVELKARPELVNKRDDKVANSLFWHYLNDLDGRVKRGENTYYIHEQATNNRYTLGEFVGKHKEFSRERQYWMEIYF